MDDEISKDELVKAWHLYGARFNVFSPFDQPRPLKWDPEIEEFDEKGLTNPVYLTHSKFLDDTKEFLRERYPHSGILESPSLIFDCPAPMFQKKIKFAQVEHEDYGPIFYDPHEGGRWYTDAIRMDVSFGERYDGRVGFSCQSTSCPRDRCDLHRRRMPSGAKLSKIMGATTTREARAALATGRSRCSGGCLSYYPM